MSKKKGFNKDRRTTLWEILVPAHDNEQGTFSLKHHKRWDSYVRKLCGGVTILKSAKGQWISPNEELFHDKMIPVRILCEEDVIEEIIQFTLEHYEQKAVMAYEISARVKIIYGGE